MRIAVFLPFLLTSALLVAQNDTTYVSINSEPFSADSNTIIDARNYVYGFDLPVKNAFKWNLAAIAPLTGFSFDQFEDITNSWPLGLDLSWEHKFNALISMEAGGVLYLRSFKNAYRGFLPNQWSANIGVKRYFRRHQKQELHHISGNYLGIDIAYFRYLNMFKNEPAYFGNLNVNYGIQRRLFNRGYFNYGFGLGTLLNNKKPDISLSYFVKIGLADFRPKTRQHGLSYCSAMRCFDEDRQIFKVNLFSTAGFSLSKEEQSIWLYPEVAYERKIGNSPFSVQAEATAGMNLIRQPKDTFVYKFNSYTLGGSLQQRWYFTQRKRISMGKSGNNLSGLYCGLNVFFRKSCKLPAETPDIHSHYLGFKTSYFGITPAIGIQYRFLKHGYVDFSVRAGYQKSESSAYLNGDWVTLENGQIVMHPGPRIFHVEKEEGFVVNGGLKLGWAF